MSSVMQAGGEWTEPDVMASDLLLDFWLRQVQLRLRRELTWCWYQRTGQGGVQSDILPPPDDMLREGAHWSFNLPRRSWFFETDSVASQLSMQIREPEPDRVARARRGSFSWVCADLELSPAERFVLALALAHRLDSAMGPVCASCMNDLTRPFPTLSLAQRLWDDPAAVLSLASADHILFRAGLLLWQREAGLDWLQPLEMGRLIVEVLVEDHEGLPGSLRQLQADPLAEVPDQALWGACLQISGSSALLVPLTGAPEDDFEPWVARLAALAGRDVMALSRSGLADLGLMAYASWAWLRGVDLMLPAGVSDEDLQDLPLDLPLRWYLPGAPSGRMGLPRELSTPTFEIPELDFHHRLALLERGLGRHLEPLRPVVEESARRFRLGELRIERLTRELSAQARVTAEMLTAACRAESSGEIRQLTQRVSPRFTVDDLVLPEEQRRQFDELGRAARSLTEVHFRWGTARAWNEGGLAVLFHGPPGTGKTMAAEALAHDLDLEMYRIDLSQVISKYVGETEKNLRRIFDAADASDCVLFFDEADAIFGKRTEVKDAHDRYANIEISYLLERMERFKGLAILASNRRKDLDEAFLRRLRYSLAFPVPDSTQRECIWRGAFPPAVDTGDLDFRFLARQFAFSGGHIKSVAFNSCLQAAAEPQGKPTDGKVGRPTMGQVLMQVKRELQKLDRLSGLDQFGPYADLISEDGQ